MTYMPIDAVYGTGEMNEVGDGRGRLYKLDVLTNYINKSTQQNVSMLNEDIGAQRAVKTVICVEVTC